MTLKVHVPLPHNAYTIQIAQQQLSTLAQYLPVNTSSVALITNETVAPLYAQIVQQGLQAQGRQVLLITLPDGEAFKTLETLELIYRQLLAAHCDRHVCLVALGGGVVGDMVGFAAATYLRGVPFIQIPTTLLAQVDSSVGGKTAVNHPLGKNMIGAFYQPVAVLADLDVLDTLSDRELSAGLAEVIKYGAVLDAEFFAWCEQNMAGLIARDKKLLAYAVQRCCELKAQVVVQDEREAGVRALLNFGHTFGHAIEAGLGYGTWLHGEAVAAGMVLAAQLSVKLGLLSSADAQRLMALIQAAHLPIQAPVLGAGEFLRWMAGDKKASHGSIRYVLMHGLGAGRVQAVSDAEVSVMLHAAGQPA